VNLQAIEIVVRRLFSDAEYRFAAAEQQALTKLCLRLADGTATPTGPKAAWW
jgi:hypothetical protein